MASPAAAAIQLTQIMTQTAHLASLIPTIVASILFANGSSGNDLVIIANLQDDASFGAISSHTLVGIEVSDSSDFDAASWSAVDLIDHTNFAYPSRGHGLEAKVDLYRNFSIIAGHSHLNSEIVDDSDGGNEGNALQFVPRYVGSLWGNHTLEALAIGATWCSGLLRATPSRTISATPTRNWYAPICF